MESFTPTKTDDTISSLNSLKLISPIEPCYRSPLRDTTNCVFPTEASGGRKSEGVGSQQLPSDKREAGDENEFSLSHQSTPKKHQDCDTESDTTADYESAGEASPWEKPSNISALADYLAGVHISTPNKSHTKLTSFPFSPNSAEDECDDEVTAIISNGSHSSSQTLSFHERDMSIHKGDKIMSHVANTPFSDLSDHDEFENSKPCKRHSEGASDFSGLSLHFEAEHLNVTASGLNNDVAVSSDTNNRTLLDKCDEVFEYPPDSLNEKVEVKSSLTTENKDPCEKLSSFDNVSYKEDHTSLNISNSEVSSDHSLINDYVITTKQKIDTIFHSKREIVSNVISETKHQIDNLFKHKSPVKESNCSMDSTGNITIHCNQTKFESNLTPKKELPVDNKEDTISNTKQKIDNIFKDLSPNRDIHSFSEVSENTSAHEISTTQDLHTKSIPIQGNPDDMGNGLINAIVLAPKENLPSKSHIIFNTSNLITEGCQVINSTKQKIDQIFKSCSVSSSNVPSDSSVCSKLEDGPHDLSSDKFSVNNTSRKEGKDSLIIHEVTKSLIERVVADIDEDFEKLEIPLAKDMNVEISASGIEQQTAEISASENDQQSGMIGTEKDGKSRPEVGETLKSGGAQKVAVFNESHPEVSSVSIDNHLPSLVYDIESRENEMESNNQIFTPGSSNSEKIMDQGMIYSFDIEKQRDISQEQKNSVTNFLYNPNTSDLNDETFVEKRMKEINKNQIVEENDKFNNSSSNPQVVESSMSVKVKDKIIIKKEEESSENLEVLSPMTTHSVIEIEKKMCENVISDIPSITTPLIGSMDLTIEGITEICSESEIHCSDPELSETSLSINQTAVEVCPSNSKSTEREVLVEAEKNLAGHPECHETLGNNVVDERNELSPVKIPEEVSNVTVDLAKEMDVSMKGGVGIICLSNIDKLKNSDNLRTDDASNLKFEPDSTVALDSNSFDVKLSPVLNITTLETSPVSNISSKEYINVSLRDIFKSTKNDNSIKTSSDVCGVPVRVPNGSDVTKSELCDKLKESNITEADIKEQVAETPRFNSPDTRSPPSDISSDKNHQILLGNEIVEIENKPRQEISSMNSSCNKYGSPTVKDRTSQEPLSVNIHTEGFSNDKLKPLKEDTVFSSADLILETTKSCERSSLKKDISSNSEVLEDMKGTSFIEESKNLEIADSTESKQFTSLVHSTSAETNAVVDGSSDLQNLNSTLESSNSKKFSSPSSCDSLSYKSILGDSSSLSLVSISDIDVKSEKKIESRLELASTTSVNSFPSIPASFSNSSSAEIGITDSNNICFVKKDIVSKEIIESLSSQQDILRTQGEMTTTKNEKFSSNFNKTVQEFKDSPDFYGLNESLKTFKLDDLSKSTIERKSYEDLLDRCLEQERLLGFDESIKEEADKLIQEIANASSDTDTLSQPNDLPPANANSSEAGPITADEDLNKGDLFQDATLFDFDYLSKIGKGKQGHRLVRESLFLKFDPLATQTASTPEPAEMAQADSSSDAIATPPRPPVTNGDDKLISISPNEESYCSPASSTVATPPRAKPRPPSGAGTPTLRHEILSREISKLQDLMLRQECSYQEQIAACTEEVELLREKITELEARENQENLHEKLQTSEAEVIQLKKELAEAADNKKQLMLIMGEYEKTISQVVTMREDDMKKFEVDKQTIAGERDQAVRHLANMEIAFNDVHHKYEKCKEVIEAFKYNEEQYKISLNGNEKTIIQLRENYQKLKDHAAEKLEQANIEISEMRKAHQAELAKMVAVQRKMEIRVKSLEESLEQKKREVAELTKICDDLITKVEQ